MKPKRFDRLWLYPEIIGQLTLAIDDEPTLARVRELVEAGRIKAIERWVAEADVPEIAQRLVRLGIPDRGGWYCPMLFDEIVMATRSYDDLCGSATYLLCRRVGDVFRHRVYQDGHGVNLDTFDADAPMSRREVRRGDWDPMKGEATAKCHLLIWGS